MVLNIKIKSCPYNRNYHQINGGNFAIQEPLLEQRVRLGVWDYYIVDFYENGDERPVSFKTNNYMSPETITILRKIVS